MDGVEQDLEPAVRHLKAQEPYTRRSPRYSIVLRVELRVIRVNRVNLTLLDLSTLFHCYFGFFLPFHLVPYCIVYYIFPTQKKKLSRETRLCGHSAVYHRKLGPRTIRLNLVNIKGMAT